MTEAVRIPEPEFTSFQDAIRSRDFVVTAQPPLAPMTTADDLRESVGVLRPSVDAVQIPDNVTAEPHMSPIAAASVVLGCGMDAVVHLNCRDRNRIALQSDLTGAVVIGVTSFVLTRGEKFPASLQQRVKSVFDIGAKRLLATAQVIGAAQQLVRPPGLLLGSNITVIDPPEGWSAKGVDTKAGAGSKFVQTQPCLNVAVLQRYMAALVARKALQKISVLVQVPLLDSPETLEGLSSGRRSALIPPRVAKRLASAGDFGEEAARVCAEVLRDVAAIPGVSGANVLYRGGPDRVARVIRESGVRPG